MALTSSPFAFAWDGSVKVETSISAALQKLPGALSGFAVNQVENHIEIGRESIEALRLVIDNDIGAKRANKRDSRSIRL
jgi:hypothetical protein